jgi:hypothetical protein
LKKGGGRDGGRRGGLPAHARQDTDGQEYQEGDENELSNALEEVLLLFTDAMTVLIGGAGVSFDPLLEPQLKKVGRR